ncbi:MAG: malate dehydrogenase [Gimesia sp.]|nr:malate dehydrogenase [Gimesia sp.]
MAHSSEKSPTHSVDQVFYQEADAFFKTHAHTALTYDDITLATRYSDVLPRKAQVDTALSERLKLHIPIISSDMDTVTESEMAIAMALNGGLGLIHYNMTEAQQVKEVARVKNFVHGLIQEPITAKPDQHIGDLLKLIENKQYNFKTFPVVDTHGKLLGLVPSAVVKERYKGRTVKEAMHARKELYTLDEVAIEKDPIAAADAFFNEHLGIHKVLVVDKNDTLRGLFTLSDIERIIEERAATVKPTRDAQFRLLCGAAVSATRTASGDLDKQRILGHVGNLVQEGVDAVAISTAHGHTLGVGETVKLLRQEHPELTLIAGNVTSAEGVDFLADAGADAIKIGQGPGSICTTRIVAGVGIPQMTALYVASKSASRGKVRLIADGGITKSGDIVKAMTLSDAVICGGVLAGCKEAPGKILEINGKLYKEYRGMGSLEAMQAGSAARYGQSNLDKNRKATAEGVEALKEVSGAVRETLLQLVGGLQSGMGYLGAPSLEALHSQARFARITPAGQRESAPHDIIEIKTAKNS